jgi:hypothetical protein
MKAYVYLRQYFAVYEIFKRNALCRHFKINERRMTEPESPKIHLAPPKGPEIGAKFRRLLSVGFTYTFKW